MASLSPDPSLQNKSLVSPSSEELGEGMMALGALSFVFLTDLLERRGEKERARGTLM